MRRARRVAVLSDVHGNATALAAVLDELSGQEHDLIVFGGDLTWGAQPVETHRLASSLEALFVRGNADRALLEGAAESERERWMQESHTTEMLEFAPWLRGERRRRDRRSGRGAFLPRLAA